MKKTLLIIMCAVACVSAYGESTQRRYVGGDISMLPMYEQHNSAYKDVYGQTINDLISWMREDAGWNTFRVRLFVNPTEGNGVVQDLQYVTSLGQRIKAAGGYLMLDFHYSDTWVDATHIQAPAAWKGSSDAAMADSVGAYTRRVLETMKAAGATPDLVQVGNEIMYGLCGIKVAPYDKSDSNWEGYLGLLRAGCDAVREVLPDAQIIIHTDRPTNSSYNRYYYRKVIDGGVDFDVIGLSYYPFWHGYLTDAQVSGKSDKNNLVKAINQLATDFPDKRVQIVECAYNFQYWPTSGVNYNTQDKWACSKEGQYAFVKDLVDALEPLENVDGISYWFPEEAGNGDDTNWNTSNGTVITTWQNRGFWDENTSKSGHTINRTATATDGRTPEQVCAPYYMKRFLGGSIMSNGEWANGRMVKVTKSIVNGRLVIEANGVRYSATGEVISDDRGASR